MRMREKRKRRRTRRMRRTKSRKMRRWTRRRKSGHTTEQFNNEVFYVTPVL